jgi:hypothetical protein
VYQFRDLIEINPKGAKLKEIFNCLGVQLPNFQSSGVKKKMSIAAETPPLLVEPLAAETPPLLVEHIYLFYMFYMFLYVLFLILPYLS